ncbi:hypothetical protein CISIN_1g040042mg, partial [Citrus sinensis]
MVLHMLSLSSCSFTKLLHRNQISLGLPRSCHFTPFQVQCLGKSYAKRIEELKADVRAMLDKAVVMDPLHQFELRDALQRLGVSYHFGDEIKKLRNAIYRNNNLQKQESLYDVALEFRLLRQHGYDTATTASIQLKFFDDWKGILSMYEAAYLLVEGENIFYEIRNFTTTYLKEYIKHNKDPYILTLVNHALELPLHWRMQRMETRWFIDAYESGPDINHVLLELAKLDFNMVQAKHQEDLESVSEWWEYVGFGNKLNFARDRLMENFLWTVGVTSEPQFGYFRRMSTKVSALITSIDDAYDVYGTLDELKLFTNSVERWDVSAMDQHPYYLKFCFLALHNFIMKLLLTLSKKKKLTSFVILKK